jgi:hypothetical protein
MAGVEPTTVIHDGDPWLFSLSKNKHRRHLTTDQIAIVAARLATRTVGNPNFTIGSAEPIGIAEAAEASGVPETAVKSAKVVLRHGTPEEKKRVETGAAPLRKTADRIRHRMRTSETAKKAEPLKAPIANPDPIDDVACTLITRAGDGGWRALPKMASIADATASTVRDALKRLGPDCVERRARSEMGSNIASTETACSPTRTLILRASSPPTSGANSPEKILRSPG